MPMESETVPSWTGNKKSEEAIDEPTSLDILCGKDHVSNCHPGNRCFRELVGFSVEEFKSLSTLTEKNMFLIAIVKSIRISGGRFLRRQPNGRGWEQVDLKGTREKVRQAFQDAVMRRRKQPNIHNQDLSPVSKPDYHSAKHFDWRGIVMNAESANRTHPLPHEVILEPTDLDILHGRDDFSVHHIGNVCFRTLIGFSLEHYVILSTRSEKTEFLGAIVNAIHNSGGRFLRRRQHGGWWEQDDIQKAKETVGHTLRNVIKKPEILKSSSLIDESDLFSHYKTTYGFDWRGMVEIAYHLQSEMKNSSATENVDAHREGGLSDPIVNWLLSSNDMSFPDYLGMDSFQEQQVNASSGSLAALKTSFVAPN